MTNTNSKKAYKLKAETPKDSKEALNLFEELGYKSNLDYMFPIAPYLYAHSNGRLGFDFLDSKDHEQEIVSTSAYYFKHHEATEITLEELRNLVRLEPNSQDRDEAKFYNLYLEATRHAP